MPTYTYQCKQCKKEVDLIRSVRDIDLPLAEEDLKHEEGCIPETREIGRILNAPPQKAYGESWGNRKGYY